MLYVQPICKDNKNMENDHSVRQKAPYFLDRPYQQTSGEQEIEKVQRINSVFFSGQWA
jgi:hypothetical protein